MKIGRYNFFEVASAVDSCDIGDMNEFQFKSIVSEGSKVESFCQINPFVTVPKNTHLKNYSVVYDDGGKLRMNEDFNEDQKKLSMKELTQFLAVHLSKHNKQREQQQPPLQTP